MDGIYINVRLALRAWAYRWAGISLVRNKHCPMIQSYEEWAMPKIQTYLIRFLSLSIFKERPTNVL